jgi:hypothetical protein
MVKEIEYKEVVDGFNAFSVITGGKIIIPCKSDISSGGAVQDLTIELIVEENDAKVIVKQTYSCLFSEPEKLSVQTGLSIVLEKASASNYYLSFWKRSLIEQLFAMNNINSGNTEFNRNFSAKSNIPNVFGTFFNNYDVQNLFLCNKLLVFNIETTDGILKITLKNMNKKAYSVSELQQIFEYFKIIERNLKCSIIDL